MKEANPTLAGERLRAAEAIFQAVVDLPAAERAAELERACGGDRELRRFVERLLGNEARGMGAFLETAAASLLLSATPPRAADMPARIGQYTITRRIGEGGMGVVYEARQEHPHRTVALKVIRPGFATPALLRRFQMEAEVLGQLQHPGIAHIYEAGVADGVAYFAMECIRGRPLGEFVAAARLSQRKILELVAQICDAVHHAHQKGVIHRDLKPGNILVVDEGGEDSHGWAADGRQYPVSATAASAGPWSPQPKILDFGVARTVRPDLETMSLYTEVGQLVGTVPYMSPEQVAGDSRQIDVRSDVYALGVITYELLAGRLPLDVRNCSIPEAANIIREREPSRLSSLSAVFRGDVDTIVAKALEKDRSRRYQSATELASDIRRCLRDEPIVARPASAMYHLVKFARRHRAFVIGFTAAVLALLIGATVAVVFAVRERQERWRADAKTLESERLAYRTSLTAASGALQTGNVDVARRALAEAPARLRGWEWGHLAAVSDQSLLTLQRHSAVVNGIASSDDGQRVATSDASGELCIWNGVSGQLVHSDRLAEPGWWGWALSPDGRTLVRSDGESAVCAQDADTGTERWRFDRPGVVTTRSFLPDGSAIVIASASEPVVRFFDPETGSELRVMPVDQPYAAGAIVNSDGSLVACCRGPYVAVFDVTTGQKLHGFDTWSWRFGAAPGHLYYSDPAGLRLLDARTGTMLSVLERGDFADDIVDRPDGCATLFWSRAEFRTIRDACTGVDLAKLVSHSRMSCAEYTRDGRRLLTGGLDGSVRVWDASASPMPFVIRSGWQEQVVSAAVSPDGTIVVGAGWGVVAAYDAADGGLRWRSAVSRRSLLAAAFDARGERLALGAGKGAVILMDRDGRLLATAPPFCDSAVRAVEFIGNGDRLMAGCEDGTLRVISTTISPSAAAAPQRPPALRAQVTAPVPLLTVTQIGALDRLEGPITALASHPKRALAAIAVRLAAEVASRTATPGNGAPIARILLFDADRLEVRPFADCAASVRALAFSPDGAFLACGEDQCVVLRSLAGGVPARTLRDAGAFVARIAFNPDGSRLVAGCEDGTFHVWATSTEDHLAAFSVCDETVLAARFAPDGATLLAAALDVPLIAFETRPVGNRAARREQVLRVRAICDPLLAKLRLAESVIEEVQRNEVLPATVRDAVVRHIHARGEHMNWANSDAWGVAREPSKSAAAIALALRQAQLANAACPGEPSLLNTLGTILYRAGDFSAAEAALLDSDSLYCAIGHGPQPANWAVIAMCRQCAGNGDAAAEALQQARETVHRPEFAGDRETQALLNEAIALIEQR